MLTAESKYIGQSRIGGILEAVTIIVPVYNEGAGLADILDQASALLTSEQFQGHFILVNDGSTDDSARILNDVDGRPGYTVITHDCNYGYGAALKSGLRRAATPYVGIIDADGTYPVGRLPDLIERLREGYAMAVGSRSDQVCREAFGRRFAKWWLTRLANYLAGRSIPDLNSGMRVMARDQVDRFLSILPDGFSFTTTITLAMLTKHLPVAYVPVPYYPRVGRSKIRPVYDTLNFLQLMLRTAVYFRPLKVFGPLSGLLLGSAFLVLGLSYSLTGQIMDVTFGVLILSAVIVMVMGLLADLIVKTAG